MPRTAFFAMGSRISIEAAEDSPEIQAALRRVPGWFRGWEDCFSRFRPDSELSRLNAFGMQSTPVSQALWSVLRAARRGARQTGGLVTPTVLAALEAAGYTQSFEKIDPEKIPNTHQPAQSGLDAWRTIDLDGKNHSVRIPDGIRLDLGGFAKGWAADRAARRLGKLTPVLVNAGGDIAISAPRPGDQPWLVGVGRPEDETQHAAVLPVWQGGVATSGRNYRRWEQDGAIRHHLIDPRTGQPAHTDVLAATVTAPSALEAETAAKAVFILGSKQGLKWLAKHTHLAGILALENGEVLSSPSLRAYLR